MRLCTDFVQKHGGEVKLEALVASRAEPASRPRTRPSLPSCGRELDEVLARVFAVLKHQGIFGLVDHRAKPDAAPPGAGGYLREDWVIAQVEEAGLRFVAKSEINANPKDTTDHPKGVWTLPPT